MNTRSRRERRRAVAPVGLGTPQASVLRRQATPHLEVPAPPALACGIAEAMSCRHPLSNLAENARLRHFDEHLRGRFQAVVPALRRIAQLQTHPDFVARAQAVADEAFGFTLPSRLLEDAWIAPLDMRAIYGYVMGRVIRAAAEETHALTNGGDGGMESFFLECGYHAVDISPCSDGRLKGVIRYTLRLPDDAIHSRKAYAGAMFDVEANVQRWVQTEFRRYREGYPVPPEVPTRYLKIAIYHWSSSDPEHQGCAAHGSDTRRAAAAALQRLREFRQAIEASYCCGSSVDLLLIGVDTDTDAIRVHVPDERGDLALDRYVDNAELYQATMLLDPDRARLAIYDAIEAAARAAGGSSPHEGMRRLIATLLINNLSQIDYVCERWGACYPDIGHNELFISVGDGFEEFQLRNLAYFVYLHTVEEAVADLDVGIHIFEGLNLRHGLPIPVAIHYRYDRRVPGSRERAIERCLRVRDAIRTRYEELCRRSLLVCDLTIQDAPFASPIEPIEMEDEEPSYRVGPGGAR